MEPLGQQQTIPLLVICGPTASGKTALAVHLAQQLQGEVVSADSMQIYKGMDIGTAKPDQKEQNGVPHHLLSVVEPHEECSLVEYLAMAKAAIEDIYGRGKLPILAGGTGLYIHSLVDNLRFEEIPASPELRTELEQEAREKGRDHLWKQLQACDPELTEKLHPNNVGRVIRALEVYRTTGETMTELQRRSRETQSPYDLCMLGLCFTHRDILYGRINTRVEDMMALGLEKEAHSLWKTGLSKTASQAIGYKELFAYFENRCTHEEAIQLIQQRSRNYAKRQMTWLRRDPRIVWLDWEAYENQGLLLDWAVQLAKKALDWETDTDVRR